MHKLLIASYLEAIQSAMYSPKVRTMNLLVDLEIDIKQDLTLTLPETKILLSLIKNLNILNSEE